MIKILFYEDPINSKQLTSIISPTLKNIVYVFLWLWNGHSLLSTWLHRRIGRSITRAIALFWQHETFANIDRGSTNPGYWWRSASLLIRWISAFACRCIGGHSHRWRSLFWANLITTIAEMIDCCSSNRDLQRTPKE